MSTPPSSSSGKPNPLIWAVGGLAALVVVLLIVVVLQANGRPRAEETVVRVPAPAPAAPPEPVPSPVVAPAAPAAAPANATRLPDPGVAIRPIIGSLAAGKAPPAAKPETTSPDTTAEDGLYVRGLPLSLGVSRAKVLEKLGVEDERFSGEGTVSYSWKLKGGDALTVEFDSAGSVRSATLALGKGKPGDDAPYALLHGTRVSPRRTTLGEVRRLLPGGLLGKPWSAEGLSNQTYTVYFGGEDSESMAFGVLWENDSPGTDKEQPKRDAMPIANITVGAAKVPGGE
jgi:hypothetical protein